MEGLVNKYDFTIVGGGIVGLSVAKALTRRYNGRAKVLVLEKENTWAAHQTGHNSGVIHSGIYYKPGSLKARYATAGNRSMVEFCQEHGIAHEVCGKVIVATEERELPLLENLFARGQANGLPIRRIGAEELREIEPHVRGIAAIHVPTAGIADYVQVAAAYARIAAEQGAELRLGTRVSGVRQADGGLIIETDRGEFRTGFLVNCAGLFSDRVAKLAGQQSEAKIVPFRGEYYELVPERRYLCKHLIYPVPNPAFPFLGVHFTRMVDSNIHCGPNAVLSLKREGYRKTDFNLADFAEVMAYPGFWKLAAKHADEGIREIVRSFSKRAFVHSLQQLIPEVQSEDLVVSRAGVRAQALNPDGKLVDDFAIVQGPYAIHVCNAPSPAATASLPIGEAVMDRIAELVPAQSFITR